MSHQPLNKENQTMTLPHDVPEKLMDVCEDYEDASWNTYSQPTPFGEDDLYWNAPFEVPRSPAPSPLALSFHQEQASEPAVSNAMALQQNPCAVEEMEDSFTREAYTQQMFGHDPLEDFDEFFVDFWSQKESEEEEVEDLFTRPFETRDPEEEEHLRRQCSSLASTMGYKQHGEWAVQLLMKMFCTCGNVSASSKALLREFNKGHSLEALYLAWELRQLWMEHLPNWCSYNRQDAVAHQMNWSDATLLATRFYEEFAHDPEHLCELLDHMREFWMEEREAGYRTRRFYGSTQSVSRYLHRPAPHYYDVGWEGYPPARFFDYVASCLEEMPAHMELDYWVSEHLHNAPAQSCRDLAPYSDRPDEYLASEDLTAHVDLLWDGLKR